MRDAANQLLHLTNNYAHQTRDVTGHLTGRVQNVNVQCNFAHVGVGGNARADCLAGDARDCSALVNCAPDQREFQHNLQCRRGCRYERLLETRPLVI